VQNACPNSMYYFYSSCGSYGKSSSWTGRGKWITVPLQQTGGEGKKKYGLSWELNPDHLPSACNQEDLLGRGLTIRPLCLVDVAKHIACLNASFSLLLAYTICHQSDFSKELPIQTNFLDHHN